MKKTKFSKRIASVILCVAMIMTCVSFSSANVAVAASANADIIVDPSISGAWETMMGTDADGNRYAGRVWADKSVYADDEAFQVVFSVLGSSMSISDTKISSGPMDVVIILDNSNSMNDIVSGSNVTRLQKVIEAANGLLEKLLEMYDIRIVLRRTITMRKLYCHLALTQTV